MVSCRSVRWAGVSYKWNKLTAYCNYSEGIYDDLTRDFSNVAGNPVHDILQVPGISYEFKKYLTAAAEYCYWYRTRSGNFSMNDNSINFYLKASL